jgi:hypothetical protein
VEWKIVSLKVSIHLEQRLYAKSLEATTLFEADGRRKIESTHATASSYTSGEHILALGIDVSGRELGYVHVCWLRGLCVVIALACNGDWVKKLSEGVIALLITRNQTHSLDVRMARVVYTCLDAISKSGTTLCLLVLELVIHLRILHKELSHKARMLGEVWHLVWTPVVNTKRCVLLRAVVRHVTATSLDPLRHFLHTWSDSVWWVVWVWLRPSSETEQRLTLGGCAL